MVSSVTKDNYRDFSRLAPMDFVDYIDREGFFALGFYSRYDEDPDRRIGSGILVFSAEYRRYRDTLELGIVIKWVQVDKDYRKRGIANALLDRMNKVISDCGQDIVGITCDIPLDGKYNICCNWLVDKGYDLFFDRVYEFGLRLGALSDHPMFNVDRVAKDIVLRPLEDMSGRMLQSFMADVLDFKFGSELPESIYALDQTKIDQRVSTVMFSKESGKPVGLLLVTEEPSGTKRSVILETLPAYDKKLPYLISHSYNIAKEIYKDSDLFVINISTERGARLVQALFPEQRPATVRRAVYLFLGGKDGR